MGRTFIKRRLRGSHTVEAAILLPLGIGVVLFLVSFSLILHDRVVLCAWISETAQQAVFQKESGNGGRTEQIGGGQTQGGSGQTAVPALVSRLAGTVEKTGKTVAISCRGSGSFVSPFVKIVFFLREPRLEGQKQVQLLYGEEIVRKRRR